MVAACTGAIERASNQSEPVGEEARDCNVRAEQKRVRMSKLDRAPFGGCLCESSVVSRRAALDERRGEREREERRL